jgi:hypothetical protein
MRINRWILGVGVAVVLIGPGCARSDDGLDDETHFQACKTQSDCADAGEAMVCTGGFCREPLPSSSGSGGAPGGGPPCDDGTLVPEQGPADRSCYSTAGNAGAIGYTNCTSYEAAGLADLDCGAGPGADGKEALVGWCAHVDAIPSMSFLGQAVARCGAPLLVGAPGQGVLDVQAVCSAELRATLRQCGDELTPCPQPPLCIGSGVWGCDEIRSACPALPESACRAGFDSRDFSGRMTIHDCITTAPATEDCAAAFYRCVWGL